MLRRHLLLITFILLLACLPIHAQSTTLWDLQSCERYERINLPACSRHLPGTLLQPR
jgi:hypothetical protein